MSKRIQLISMMLCLTVVSAKTLLAETIAEGIAIDVKKIVFVQGCDNGFETTIDKKVLGRDVLLDTLKKSFSAKKFKLEVAKEAMQGRFQKAKPATLIVLVKSTSNETLRIEKLGTIERKSDCPNNSFYRIETGELANHDSKIVRPLIVAWTRISHRTVGGLNEKTLVSKINFANDWVGTEAENGEVVRNAHSVPTAEVVLALASK